MRLVADIEDATPDFSEASGPSAKTHSLNFGAIKQKNRLAAIPNSDKIELKLGSEEELFVSGNNVSVRKSVLSGKVPGTDLVFPTIHVMSQEVFNRLHSDGDPLSVTLGIFEPSVESNGRQGVIDVNMLGTKGKELPGSLVLPAAQVKLLFSTIYHEGIHAAGGEEFAAFMGQREYEHAVGLKAEAPDPVEVMKHIHDFYDSSAVAKAEDEFYAHCDKHGLKEAILEYAKLVEERATDIGDIGDFEDYDSDFRDYSREYPAASVADYEDFSDLNFDFRSYTRVARGKAA